MFQVVTWQRPPAVCGHNSIALNTSKQYLPLAKGHPSDAASKPYLRFKIPSLVAKYGEIWASDRVDSQLLCGGRSLMVKSAW